MKIKSTLYLRIVYCLVLVGTIFPVGPFSASGWIGLALGGGLFRFGFVVPIVCALLVIYRVLSVIRNPSALDVYVSGKPSRALRAIGIFLMYFGLVCMLGLFLAIGDFVISLYLIMLSAFGLIGVAIFEIVRLFGLRLRGSDRGAEEGVSNPPLPSRESLTTQNIVPWLKEHKGAVVVVVAVLVFGFLVKTCIFPGSVSWKEEVQLHDGSILVIKRFYHVGGYPALESRERQALDETVSFVLPGTNKKIVWKTDFRNSVPEPNCLNMLLLDIVNGTPYIATYPAGCIAYNKWGRPNPPYIFLKYDGSEWKRIPLEQFPAELKKVNVIVGRPPAELQKPFYTVAAVNEANRNITTEDYRTILRKPLERDPNSASQVGCPELVYDGKGGWLGIDWFTSQPSYDPCVAVCTRDKISKDYCPCERLFKAR